MYTIYQDCVHDERDVTLVGIKKGTKLTDTPKNIQLKIRADEQTMQDLEFCCEKLNKTKSDIIRLGIQKVKAEVQEWKNPCTTKPSSNNARVPTIKKTYGKYILPHGFPFIKKGF